MSDTPDEQDRIEDLEVMAAHQAQTIDELSDQLRHAFEAIDSLQRSVTVLTERLQSVEDVAVPRPEVTKPPHY